ncbi:hypothetical protein [Zymobacter sp. IVIA_12111.31 C1]|uniref:hypothetical protein n=1 Tax=Zymobacter sp. IVIA_12111.31 C1 TaxID=3394854 RepID=UPI0039C237F5
MNKKFRKIIVIGMSAISIFTSFQALADTSKFDSSVISQHNHMISDKNFVEDLLRNGTLNMNDDDGSAEYIIEKERVERLENGETLFTKPSTFVTAQYDSTNAIGVIQIVQAQRDSSGNVRLTQRYFTPFDFDKISEGGRLSNNAFSEIEEKYGQNPFNSFKTGDNKYKHAFINIDINAFMTIVSLSSLQNNAINSILAVGNNEPSLEKKKGGGKIRKKITYTIRVKQTPSYFIGLPKNIGEGSGEAGISSYYKLKNGKTVVGATKFYESSKFASNFDYDVDEVYTDSMTKKSWTGIALVITGIAIGALTGGLGLVGTLTAVSGGLVGGGIMVGSAVLSGNTNLENPVSGNFGDVTGISKVRSLDNYDEFGTKWKNEVRDQTTGNSDKNTAVKRQVKKSERDFDEIWKPVDF